MDANEELKLRFCIKKKIGGGEREGQGECERRFEVFVKMQEKTIGGTGLVGGVRAD